MSTAPHRRHRRSWQIGVALIAGCASAALLVGSATAKVRVQQPSLSGSAFAKIKQKARRAPLKVKRAPSVDLACLATFQFDFSPNLDNNTVSAQTTASLANCISPNSSRPDLNSAVLFADRGHSTATGCAPAPLSVDGVGSILWNDQTSSNFTFAVHTNPLDPKFGLTANIITGTFAGHLITAVPALITQFGFCGIGGTDSLAVNFGVDIVTH